MVVRTNTKFYVYVFVAIITAVLLFALHIERQKAKSEDGVHAGKPEQTVLLITVEKYTEEPCVDHTSVHAAEAKKPVNCLDAARDIIFALLGGVISSVVLWAVDNSMVRYFSQAHREVQLWRLTEPQNCHLVVSSFLQQTYRSLWRKIPKRYVVGLGQIEALPYVLASLTKAYNSLFNGANVMHANDDRARKLVSDGKKDLILIGGALTNPLVREVFEVIRDRIIISKVDNSGVCVKQIHCDSASNYACSSNFKSEESGIRHDVAIIVSCMHNERRIVVLAGGSTYGTGAVARYFCEEFRNGREYRAHKNGDYVAVVECMFKYHPPVYQESRILHIFKI